jgi:hypothetical protein
MVEVNGSRRGTKAFRRTGTQSHGQWCGAATDGPHEGVLDSFLDNVLDSVHDDFHDRARPG